jgi:DMSO/TMAO reductase YedYZ molybdopterin-dependent catalytic subunit
MAAPPAGGVVRGGLAAVVGLAAAELVAGALRTGRSPVIAVADAVVRSAPVSWERWAIDTFGTGDKPALIAAVLVVTVTLGAIAGALPRWAGAVVVVAVAGAGALAAVAEPDASGSHALAPVLGGLAAGAVLELLRRAVGDHRDAPLPPPGADRRRFLVAGSTAALVAAAGASVGRSLQGRTSAAASRAAVRLPPAREALGSAPSPGGVATPGLSPFLTPNADFYRIDTALTVPQVEAETWSLTIDGMVETPRRYTFDDLVDRPLVEREVTLACVSNEVGGDLVGTARWLGVPLVELLDEAGPRADADQLVGRSVDDFTAGFPLDVARDGRTALVVLGMNGEPLPLRHGFPARLVVAGLYGYVSATKWLEQIEVTRFDAYDPYWVQRGWADRAPIKVSSRIDTPRKRVEAGMVPVAGVAWAPSRGIAKVEVRVDDGSWHEAALAPGGGVDTWRQWRWDWRATPGDHDLQVRATTADGERQTGEEHVPFPDGATGWHTVRVEVARR